MGRGRGPRQGRIALIGCAGLLLLAAVPWGAWAEVQPRGLADAPADPEVVEEAFQPRRVALLIGIDRYDDEAFPSLLFARDDAEDLATILRDPLRGGFDDVVVLTDPQRTTRVEILAALDDLTVPLQRNDTVLIYFSGHGTLSTEPSGGSTLYVCPRDADQQRPESTAIAVDTLQRILKRLPCRRKVMVLDSCHNGEAKSVLTAETLDRLSRRRSAIDPRILTRVGEAEAHLFAAAFHQPALEDPELGHGVYTHYLMQALGDRMDESDLDRDGVVSVVEAHQYARDHTISHTGGAQVPRALFREVGREDIFLSGGDDSLWAAEKGLLTSYGRLLAQCRIRVDGQPRGSLPRTIPVEPGVHRVEVVAPGSGEMLVQRTVRVLPGQSLSVDALVDEHRPEGRHSFAGGVSMWGVAGPFSQNYPGFSAGPDVSYRHRFVGRARTVRLSVDASYAHGEGVYSAAQDLSIRADAIRVGVGVQACGDVQRASLWIGPRVQMMVVWVRRVDAEGTVHPPQSALMPAPGLVAGVDLWGPRHFGVQFAGFIDLYAPPVEDMFGTPETRTGAMIGGQLRLLGRVQ